MWGIFNPMGPTIGAVFLADVPGQERALLAYAFVNPFASESVVAGVLERGSAADEEHVVTAVDHLFRANGFEDYPLVAGLPTYITLGPNSPVAGNQLRDFVFNAVKLAAPVDLRQETQ